MRYDEGIIEQIRNANDIVDVIGQYVRLTKKGANYFGLCPFHGEKTASFSVSPRKQIYYCFGCGAGGNVIHFVKEYENFTFNEALKNLADRAHIVLPEPNIKSEDSETKELKSKLLEINKKAAFFYNDLLRQKDGETGLNYFINTRKLNPRTITHFGLGYSAKSSDRLYQYLKQEGFADDILSKSGLFTYSEKGVNDKFWNRVMFPIMDVNNRVVGFGGRVLGEGMPKYLNSPETLIFDKSSILFGLNFAKKSRANAFLLCEGYMDVIALHEAGFTNSVACLGTALTEKHARLLKRYTDNVILTQDSDSAGIKAKIRAYPILRSAGLNVKVLNIKNAKDPDEFIRKNGPEAFEKLIRDADNAFFFITDTLKESFNLSDPADKTAFIKQLAEKLVIFDDKMERDNYTEAVAIRYMLDTALLKQITEETYVMKIPEWKDFIPERHTAYGYKENNTENDSSIKEPDGNRLRIPANNQTIKAEKMLLSWISERPNLWLCVKDYIKPSDFDSAVMERLAAEISDSLSNESGFIKEFEPAAFLDEFSDDEEEKNLACEILSGDINGYKLDEMSRTDIEKGLTEFIKAIKLSNIEKEVGSCGDNALLFSELMRKKNELNKLYVKIKEDM